MFQCLLKTHSFREMRNMYVKFSVYTLFINPQCACGGEGYGICTWFVTVCVCLSLCYIPRLLLPHATSQAISDTNRLDTTHWLYIQKQCVEKLRRPQPYTHTPPHLKAVPHMSMCSTFLVCRGFGQSYSEKHSSIKL